MAPRTPATAAEIVAALQANSWIQKGHALPYETAVEFLQERLSATRRHAVEWLNLVSGTEPHDFELIATEGGRVHSVGRAGEDLYLGSLDEGYVETKSDASYWPRLMPDGRLVERDGDAERTEFADLAEFVVLSKDLRSMCERSEAYRARKIALTERTKELARQGAEERHGQALARLRALLVQAGIDHESALDASYRREQTRLVLTLQDHQIDAVGKLLPAIDAVDPS